MFNVEGARRISRGYHGSYHELWRDPDGQLLLGCKSKRTPGVAINWAALQQFRREGGSHVGLRNPDFNVVIELTKLDHIKPSGSDDYIVVRPSDIGLEEPDSAPCGFGNDEIPF